MAQDAIADVANESALAASGMAIVAPLEAPGDPLLVSNLAALLDRFTASVNDPDGQTVGDFASTVDALHGELAMLARHFEVAGEPVDDFWLALEGDGAESAEQALSEGLAEEEALQHLCWQLTR